MFVSKYHTKKVIKNGKKLIINLKFLLWFPEKFLIKEAPRIGHNFFTLVFKIELKKMHLQSGYYWYRHSVKLERTTTYVIIP